MDNVSNTEPREILRRALRVAQELQSLQQEQQQLEDTLSSLQSFDYQRPIVKSSGGRGSVEQVAIQVADKKARIAEQIGKLLAAKDAARKVIDLLPEGPERTVLIHRYILLGSWEQIAVDLGYSYRHVLRLHGWALRDLDDRWHCMSHDTCGMV